MNSLQEQLIGKWLNGNYMDINYCSNNEVVTLDEAVKYALALSYKNYINVEIYHVKLLDNYNACLINHAYIVPFKDLLTL